MYTIDIDGGATYEVVSCLLAAAVGRSRFTARVTAGKKAGQLLVRRVRLRQPKPYCGQHPGACPADGRRRPRLRLLEAADWIAFNDLVNSALDELGVAADVWSTPSEPLDQGRRLWVRRGLCRRVRYDWEDDPIAGRPRRVWNHGDASQFSSGLKLW
jgi:hypothetical protein